RRAGDARQRPEVLRGYAAHLEDARLARFGEKQRPLAQARRDRGGDGDLEVALGEVVGAGVDLHLELRLHLLEEHLGRVRDLERAVLEVNLFDLESGLWLGFGFAHVAALRSGSRAPWRSRS